MKNHLVILRVVLAVLMLSMLNFCTKDSTKTLTPPSVTPSLATVTTTAATTITTTGATLGGNVTSDGNATVSERGVVYATIQNPTTSNTKIVIGTGTGIFTTNVTGLTVGTTYYVRAYAVNSQGTAYGSQVTFSTLSTAGGSITDFDGNTYTSVTIGTQVWMVENLKVTKYNDGTAIPNVTSANDFSWRDLKTGAYCNYANQEGFVTTYGRLYNLYAVNTGKLAPKGWRVPTADDWATLFIFLGGESVAGGKLKATGSNWASPNLGATNVTGFTALPGGDRSGGGGFASDGGHYEIGKYGTWWSSTNVGDGAYSVLMSYDNSSAVAGNYEYGYGSNNSNFGKSVRCIKGEILSVLTAAISSNTATTAICEGNVVSDGGLNVIERGICWSATSTIPTINDNKTVVGNGIGIFTCTLTGLSYNTYYYGRAYATTSVGTVYGKIIAFRTLPVNTPFVTTASATAVNSTTATCGGTITTDNSEAITMRGVCWNTNGNPTTADNKTTEGSGVGTFTSSITGLIPYTRYWFRAYAANIAGTGYGQNVSIVLGGPVTDADGNIYQVVTIGTQVWMASNLKTTKYNDGTTIPLVTDNTAWSSLSTAGYCWYNNDAAANKSTYGAIYNWYTIKNVKLCPSGMHLPTDTEWNTMTSYLGGESVAGGKLKEIGTSHWKSPNTGATNVTGFTAVPSGYRSGDGIFYDIGNLGYWWSSMGYGANYPYHWYVNFNTSDIGKNWDYYYQQYGYSVRCLKDN